MGFVTYEDSTVDKFNEEKTIDERPAEAKKMSFARHQSFYFREGWLRKGLRGILDEPGLFLTPDAGKRLGGLGVNMVESLRYWMVATGLAVEKKESGKASQELTSIGRVIHERDPYLELDITLWIIHCLLCSNYEEAPTWFWFFNRYAKQVFNKEDFVTNLDRWVLAEGKEVAKKSLERDFECFVRTYLSFDGTPEDILVCPLGNLGLLGEVNEIGSELLDSGKRSRVFRFVRPEIKGINPLIIGWALKSWQEKYRNGVSQISFFEALREDCSPGRLFNLNTTSLLSLLGILQEQYPDISFRTVRTNNLDYIEVPDIPSETYIHKCYEAELTDDITVITDDELTQAERSVN